MLDANVPRVLERLGEQDRVLDVGGWFRPFHRATHVLDLFPYEGRGTGGHQGPEEPWFSRETWVQHDICSRQPWPFDDKFFDFAICSHVLEDVRDPIWVCQELMRVCRRGFIEVPSIEAELSLGIESRRWAGYQHHHWLVELRENGIVFHLKPHFLLGGWKYHLPRSYGASLGEAGRVQSLFWEGGFTLAESMIIHDSALRWVEERVRAVGARPDWLYQLDFAARSIRDAIRGVGRPGPAAGPSVAVVPPVPPVHDPTS